MGPIVSFIALLTCTQLANAARVLSRVRAHKVAKANYAECTWTGPEQQHFKVSFPLKIPPNQKCMFHCKNKLYEIDSHVMPSFFKSNARKQKCRCFLKGQKRALFRFRDDAGCSSRLCWTRYQDLMNYGKDKDSKVAWDNIENFQSECRECESKKDCTRSVDLPSFHIDMASVLAKVQTDDGDVAKDDLVDFIKFLQQEHIEVAPPQVSETDWDDNFAGDKTDAILEPSSGTTTSSTVSTTTTSITSPRTTTTTTSSTTSTTTTSTSTSLPKQPKTETTTTLTTTTTTVDLYELQELPCGENYLPKQCVIRPGSDWKHTLRSSDCKGNVVVVQLAVEHYLGLRFLDTHDIADQDRSIPGGLSITWGPRSLSVSHESEPLEIELLGAHEGIGLTMLLVLDGVRQRVGLHRVHTLEIISGPANAPLGSVVHSFGKYTFDKAKYKMSQPPTITQQLKRLGNSVLSFFGFSQQEHIQYHPVVEGDMKMLTWNALKTCTDASAAEVGLIDNADAEPECCDSDEDDDWSWSDDEEEEETDAKDESSNPDHDAVQDEEPDDNSSSVEDETQEDAKEEEESDDDFVWYSPDGYDGWDVHEDPLF